MRMRAPAAAAWFAFAATTAYAAFDAAGVRHLALYGIALLIGAVLLLTGFGFTGSLRRFVYGRDPEALRVPLALIALSTLAFAPVLAAGQALGQVLGPAAAPIGVQVAAGAALFGVGMQLAGGCGSGTLHGLGRGNARMIVVILFFCAGSFFASLHMGWWADLPGTTPIVLGERIGWGRAALTQTALIGAAWWWLGWLARRRGRLPAAGGHWPLWVAAIALAALNLATLVLAGHPWSITWAYALWGAKGAVQLGWDPTSSAFWQAPFQANALSAGILNDITSLMNIGLVTGAAGAAIAAGRGRIEIDRRPGPVLAAIIGGALMGYGARIAYGCTVGALLSGTASTSMHGWLWFAAVLPGVWLGAWLRPRFGLGDDRTVPVLTRPQPPGT